jgi:methyl-accepting chemotaxis protein
MMKNWTIGKRVFGALAASVSVTIIACVCALSTNYSALGALPAGSKAGEALESANVLLWIFLFASVGVASGVGYASVRGIYARLAKAAAQLRTSSEQVTSVCSQVASASQHLAEGTSEQAATLEETSASGHEISALTSRNAENSKRAADLMADVDSRVGQANSKLDEMVASMAEITNSSGRIAKIIKVIDGIAFQTNILALNAAVEAARAGEAGMGFAVVADEVRNLAQRCAQAAKDTTALIEGSVSSAESGSACLDEVAKVIRGITEGALKAKTLVDEVSHAGQEQARGMDQISKALTQMEQTTQQAAGSAEQTAAASQQLSGQADVLKHILGEIDGLTRQVQSQPAPARTDVKPVSHKSEHARCDDLMTLQRSRGVNRSANLAEPVSQRPAVKSSASEFPLDESEFHEF